jgi:hypothetical protein
MNLALSPDTAGDQPLIPNIVRAVGQALTTAEPVAPPSSKPAQHRLGEVGSRGALDHFVGDAEHILRPWRTGC